MTETPVFVIKEGLITGCWPGGEGRPIALVTDGMLSTSTTTGIDGSFLLPLPEYRLVRKAEVIDAATGLRLTKTPLEADQSVVWLGWSCAKGVIHGAFRVEAPDGFGTATLLVQAMAGGEVFMQTVAGLEKDGVYRFKGTPRRLISPDETLVAHPNVAGTMVDAPLSLTAEMIGAYGYLDADSVTDAHGWVIPLGGNTNPVAVDIYVNGALVRTIEPSIDRPDVRAAGLSTGLCGFRADLPPARLAIPQIQLQAFLAGSDTELRNSPVLPQMVLGRFDEIDGATCRGWAANRGTPGRPMRVEAVCDGEVIADGLADEPRDDVIKAGLVEHSCGFRLQLNRPLTSLTGRSIIVRDAETGLVLDGSPQHVDADNAVLHFLRREEWIGPGTAARLARRLTHRTRGITISILMPVYNTRREWLIAALNSVLGQWSAGWELICVDDGSSAPHVATLLELAAAQDPRIRVIRMDGNEGISASINRGIEAACGDFVTFLDHDDMLEPDAVYKLALAAQESDADLIYSDEVIVGENLEHILQVRARPQFSYDYYLSHPYFVHMVAVRTSLARSLGGYDPNLPISADVDFILRVIERAKAVAHVPSVLYRWRTYASSSGHQKKSEVMETTVSILNRHLQRLGTGATARADERFNEFYTDWPDDGQEVLIVIPTKNRADLLRSCIDSIERTGEGANYRIVVIDHQSDDAETVSYLDELRRRYAVMPYQGPFNYARMNNLAVSEHAGEARYVLFLNNDIEAIEPGWIQRLRSLAARPGVGAVGPLLIYGDGHVQHAGVVMGFATGADHAFRGEPAYEADGARNAGYNCSITAVRDFSAVTAACMMVPLAVFRAIGGFDESFVVGFNDTDLCLRIIDARHRVVYDGKTVLYHHESATRKAASSLDHPDDDARLRARWQNYMHGRDPFYSPMLKLADRDHALRVRGHCSPGTATRTVIISTPPVAPPVSQEPAAPCPVPEGTP